VSKHNKLKPEAEKAPYQPTEREKTALEHYRARVAAAPPAPRMKVTKGDKRAELAPDHPDLPLGSMLLMEALGTVSIDFLQGLMLQLIDAEPDEADLNFMLSVVKAIKPRDELETMLAAQMAAVHMATMTFARQLQHVENLPQQDSAERAFNKLTRTFATQMEALKRYRTGGEQKVTVQHVSVNECGQAIVGNVTQATRETTPGKPANSAMALADARQSAMPIIGGPERAPVPLRRKKDGGRSSA